MLEILKFIFSSFWIFVGSAILIGVILDGIASIIRATRRPVKIKIVKDKSDE